MCTRCRLGVVGLLVDVAVVLLCCCSCCCCCCIGKKLPRAIEYVLVRPQICIGICIKNNLNTVAQTQSMNKKKNMSRLFTRYIFSLATYRMIKTQSNVGRAIQQPHQAAVTTAKLFQLNSLNSVGIFRKLLKCMHKAHIYKLHENSAQRLLPLPFPFQFSLSLSIIIIACISFKILNTVLLVSVFSYPSLCLSNIAMHTVCTSFSLVFKL